MYYTAIKHRPTSGNGRVWKKAKASLANMKSVEQVDWREEEVVVESLLQKLWEGTAYRNTETYLTEADIS